MYEYSSILFKLFVVFHPITMWPASAITNLFTNLLHQAANLEENQNTNEQVQTKEEIPLEDKENSEPITPQTLVTASAEVKEETPSLSKQFQTSNLSAEDLSKAHIEPQTDSMEVEYPHHITRQKKWNEYLLEFFMLFLAVFLGFVAENIRENLVEKNREKEYIQSMVADMKSDINQLDSLNASRRLKEKMIDSLLLILDLPDPNLYGNQLYYYARWMPRVLRIINNDGTMQQLKSGNLRLIRNRNSVDAILEYDRLVRFENFAVEEREESLIQQFYPSLKKVFNPRVFEKMVDGMKIIRPAGNPKLLHGDKESLDELYSHLHFLKNVNTYSMEFNIRRRKLAEHVLDVLQKEYHLK